MNVSGTLKAWYLKHQRPLLWRKTTDPYKIWLSEVILQQTRVDQGTPYYIRFISTFPTVRKLAQAPENQVMKLWQGLGYYSRARNLHAAAKTISKEFKGKFPSDYMTIRTLKGVGDYTAAAISSFAFNLPHVVVDGNVYRFLSRFYGIETPVDSTQGKKEFAELAQSLLDTKNPGLHNQAIMEFGAIQCKPVSPECTICPFVLLCEARKNKSVELLPVKGKKTKVRIRYFNYLIVRYKDLVFINKREKGDIWQNLYDFPLIETKAHLESSKLPHSDEWKLLFKNQQVHIETVSTELTHKLSHQHIVTRFYKIHLTTRPNTAFRSKYIEIQFNDILKYPVPRLIESHLETHSELYAEL
ncbi:MAG TPA: A/G-specific adenine glycosylase [Bacteroidia bacterium]|nr:A/G-specific adenine glycosylase [Bacteroidia bacterium]